MEIRKIEKDWLTLDNAAKIYPATSSKRSPAIFRITVKLKSPIKLWKLQEALRRIMPRFPYFQVYLHRGFFWYYLQKHREIPEIKLMNHLSQSNLLAGKKTSHLLEISVKRSSIAVDFSHVLTDGSGGIRFMISLVAEYLRSTDHVIGKHENIFDPNENPVPDEFLDAHKSFFNSSIPKPSKLRKAFHIRNKINFQQEFRIITGRIATEKIIKSSREKGISITEYLVSVYIYCLKEIYLSYIKQGSKPNSTLIRVEVPVDMRRFYPTRTMRNFSLYVSPEIDMKLGEYSFSEIIKKVHHSMQIQVDPKELAKQTSRNVSAELNPFIRIIPLFLKDLHLSGVYSRLGEKIYSGVLSNLGKIHIPPTMIKEIESFNLIMHPNQTMKKSCSIISFDNEMRINISSTVEDREFERLFFVKLVEDGIPVAIE